MGWEGNGCPAERRATLLDTLTHTNTEIGKGNLGQAKHLAAASKSGTSCIPWGQGFLRKPPMSISPLLL